MRSLSQEAMMKASVWLLSCSLFAVAAAAIAWGSPNEDALAGANTGAGAEQASPIMLVGANGHDSVGGLMPLPLWPPHAIHAQEVVPGKSWKRRSRKCSNLPCPRLHN
jgi:hypothetical protein